MTVAHRMLSTIVLASIGTIITACSGRTNVPAAPEPVPSSPVGAYIKHIVVIVQENRSFENMFAGWPGADAPLTGYELVNGKRVPIPLRVMTYLGDKDMCHLWRDARIAFDGGKMDGFNLERGGVAGSCTGLAGDLPYRYMNHSEISPYRDLAKQYVLADHMFPTEFGTSFTAHQDLIAGTTQIDAGHSLVNTPNEMPWGCDAPRGTTTELVDRERVVSKNGPFPCLTQYPTIADQLDARHASWKYYAPPLSNFAGSIWTAFDAIDKVRHGPDWRNVVPETKALTDFAAGDLPDVSWVIPDLEWADYPAVPSDRGPSWVGDLVNAIGTSDAWNSTAIVVLWDDWGGFYDNEPPRQLDYTGLAIRVPCIIISPYARRGYVSHTEYEYGSILKFMEEAFGLGSLHTSDGRANSLTDSFDFTQKPRAFTPVPTKYPPSSFLGQSPSMRPPDDY